MDKFIGIYENSFDDAFCSGLISYFEKAPKEQLLNRQDFEGVEKTTKDDTMLFLDRNANTEEFLDTFDSVFWNVGYSMYSNNFAILKKHARHIVLEHKLQKTKPGEGYHAWHCESDNKNISHRVLAWMVYLNNVEEGGETEFLYQHLRIKPKKGTLLIWPTGFTHTHRGNPPLIGDKYVLTGWVVYE